MKWICRSILPIGTKKFEFFFFDIQVDVSTKRIFSVRFFFLESIAGMQLPVTLNEFDAYTVRRMRYTHNVCELFCPYTAYGSVQLSNRMCQMKIDSSLSFSDHGQNVFKRMKKCFNLASNLPKKNVKRSRKIINSSRIRIHRFN